MLSNEKLREKSMEELLNVMGVNTSNVTIVSEPEQFQFILEENKNINDFAQQLNILMQIKGTNKPVKVLTLVEMMDDELSSASCIRETDRAACIAIFRAINILASHFNYVSESGLLEITLPAPEYASFLRLLKYTHLTLSDDGKIQFNLREYLKKHNENVIQIEGEYASLLFLKTQDLETKKMFYATEKLEDGKLEVTPYFFAPNNKPAHFHLVLDVSASMDEPLVTETDNDPQTRLDALKKSALELVNQLFIFQPKAMVSLTTFSNGIHDLGTFNENTQSKLLDKISDLKTLRDTPLFRVTKQFIQNIIGSKEHNNILLFTDGENTASHSSDEETILAELDTLQEVSITTARNKFFILQYKTDSNTTLEKVAKTFLSEVVSLSNPDFIAALKNSEVLKDWAATRGFFNTRMVISDKAGDRSTVYPMALVLSGQLQALQKRILEQGQTLTVAVQDSQNNEIISDTYSAEPMNSPRSMAKLIGKLGINSNTVDKLTGYEKRDDNPYFVAF